MLAHIFDERIPIALLVMIIDIQNWNSNRGFDYIAYIIEQMHKGLNELKDGKAPLSFPHSSLLMHMILWIGYEKWKKFMKLRKKDDDGNDLPIQMWKFIWDQNFSHSNYLAFGNVLKGGILKILGLELV